MQNCVLKLRITQPITRQERSQVLRVRSQRGFRIYNGIHLEKGEREMRKWEMGSEEMDWKWSLNLLRPHSALLMIQSYN